MGLGLEHLMHSPPAADVYGNLESWFDLLKDLGASKDMTRNQMASLTETGYNTFCRLLRNHLIPMGIVEKDGFTRGRRGRATDTYRITPKGRALLAAVEHVEEKFGGWEPRHG